MCNNWSDQFLRGAEQRFDSVQEKISKFEYRSVEIIHSKEQIQAYFFLLYFALLHFVNTAFFFFYKLNICGNHILSKPISTIFPTVFSHFMSLSHFSTSDNI